MSESCLNFTKVRLDCQHGEYPCYHVCCLNEAAGSFHNLPGMSFTSHSNTLEIAEMDLSVIKEELEDFTAEKNGSKDKIYNLCHWKRKKINSVQSFKQFILDCTVIFAHREIKYLCGPVCLVICPSCFAVYKNYPDRLIRLYNHVIKRHSKSKNLYLKEIIKSCDQLIRFMVKTWKVKSN